jgi:hypothetical protein
MTSLEHPREAQVTVLPHKAANVASIGNNVRVSSFLELRCVFSGNSFADRFAAIPIALVVFVAVHESDFDAAVEQVAEFGKAISEDEVAGAVKACLSSVLIGEMERRTTYRVRRERIVRSS